MFTHSMELKQLLLIILYVYLEECMKIRKRKAAIWASALHREEGWCGKFEKMVMRAVYM